MDLTRSLRDASKSAMIFPPPNLRTQKLQKYRYLGSQTKSDPLFFYGGNSMHAVCTILSFFMNHEINLLWAVLLKVDNRVGTLRGLTGDKVPDSLVARAKYNEDIICYEINTNLEERSSDDDVNDWWIRVNGPERVGTLVERLSISQLRGRQAQAQQSCRDSEIWLLRWRPIPVSKP